MLSHNILPRPNWQARVETLGFDFFEVNQHIPYWVEDRYYSFTKEQINQIDKASEQLHDMCLKAVDYVFRHDLLDRFAIPKQFHHLLHDSWRNDRTYLYGRFDFAWDGNSAPKLLEYNAQTPTSLFEASVIAWDWMRSNVDRFLLPPNADQFNILDEQLILEFKHLLQSKRPATSTLHFAVCEDSEEDLRTVKYLAACADEAGWQSIWIDVSDIHLTTDNRFADHNLELIETAFWLYPYEFALLDEYAQYIEHSGMTFIEPLWKVIMSSKALLPILWQLYPGHENLLPCYFSDDPQSQTLLDRVIKPIYSREGANIVIERDGVKLESSGGHYGDESAIIQQYWPLATFEHGHCVIGSWMIGRVASGISVRESDQRITLDTARFVPHVIRV